MFEYIDGDMNEIIFQCMGNTSVTGVSGRVVFTSGADPNRLVKIERIQGTACQMHRSFACCIYLIKHPLNYAVKICMIFSRSIIKVING